MKKEEKKEKDWAGVLENLAKDKLSEVLTQAEEDRQKFSSELKAQRKGYSFSCKRHGDFFTLFITQNANKSEAYAKFPTKLSTTLNLSLVNQLDMKEGSGVTMDAVVDFSWETASISGDDDGYFYSSGSSLIPPGEGKHYVVTPKYPRMRPGRILFAENETHGADVYTNTFHHSEHIIRFSIPNYPSIYTPDVIRFKGIGKLLAPYGKGEEVFQSILKELGTWEC